MKIMNHILFIAFLATGLRAATLDVKDFGGSPEALTDRLVCERFRGVFPVRTLEEQIIANDSSICTGFGSQTNRIDIRLTLKPQGHDDWEISGLVFSHLQNTAPARSYVYKGDANLVIAEAIEAIRTFTLPDGATRWAFYGMNDSCRLMPVGPA